MGVIQDIQQKVDILYSPYRKGNKCTLIHEGEGHFDLRSCYTLFRDRHVKWHSSAWFMFALSSSSGKLNSSAAAAETAAVWDIQQTTAKSTVVVGRCYYLPATKLFERRGSVVRGGHCWRVLRQLRILQDLWIIRADCSRRRHVARALVRKLSPAAETSAYFRILHFPWK